jgi:hypothetical protein
VLRFICFLGFWLSFAGMADSVNRYFALDRAAALYESAAPAERIIQAYEDVMKSEPRGQFAIGIFRSQNESITSARTASIELLRTFQETSRMQGLFFGFLLTLFGLILARLARATRSLATAMPTARLWRGIAKADQAGRYVDHLRRDTFTALAKIDGFADASVLRRDVADGVEFIVLTRWESLDAIRKFVGRDDAEVAVVPPLVRDIMVDFDEIARHYQVVAQTRAPGAATRARDAGL